MEEINILICSTGSVATIKLPSLIDTLVKEGSCKFVLNVKHCVTERGKHFLNEEIECSEGYSDSDEWNAWKNRGDPVLHIELSKWADILVIAPLDANSLAKIANGMCDNLILCLVRAWDLSKPLIFCPAMNTKMWTHPITASHITTLENWGYIHVPPISKLLMCGEMGIGAMAEISQIVEVVMRYIPVVILKKKQKLSD